MIPHCAPLLRRRLLIARRYKSPFLPAAGASPVALVQKGTTPDQKTIIASLETLEETVKNHKFESPTLIIIGEVVSLKEKLDWFNPDDPQGVAVKASKW